MTGHPRRYAGFPSTALAVLLGAAGLSRGAAAGDAPAAAGPALPVGVVRVMDVLEKYDFYIERRDQITKELEPAKRDFEAKTQEMAKLNAELQQFRNQGLMETHPKVAGLMLQMQNLELQINMVVQSGGERERDRIVKLVADAYRYINASCRRVGAHFRFSMVMFAINPEIADEAINSTQTTPQVLMNMILLRSVQYVFPQYDITETVIKDLNERFAEYKAAVAGGNQNAAIYPAFPKKGPFG